MHKTLFSTFLYKRIFNLYMLYLYISDNSTNVNKAAQKVPRSQNP